MCSSDLTMSLRGQLWYTVKLPLLYIHFRIFIAKNNHAQITSVLQASDLQQRSLRLNFFHYRFSQLSKMTRNNSLFSDGRPKENLFYVHHWTRACVRACGRGNLLPKVPRMNKIQLSPQRKTCIYCRLKSLQRIGISEKSTQSFIKKKKTLNIYFK